MRKEILKATMTVSENEKGKFEYYLDCMFFVEFPIEGLDKRAFLKFALEEALHRAKWICDDEEDRKERNGNN